VELHARLCAPNWWVTPWPSPQPNCLPPALQAVAEAEHCLAADADRAAGGLGTTSRNAARPTGRNPTWLPNPVLDLLPGTPAE